ncbi:MAG: amino acid adenylation domain-containing protein, partial [Chitinophagaceae bacterium]
MNQGSQDHGSDMGSTQHPVALIAGVPHRGRGELFPATDGQRQLWYLYRLDPADDRYHKPISLILRGQLDTSSLETALNEIIDKHAPLHSVFMELDGELYQQEDDPKGFILEKRDLSGLPTDLGDMAAGEATRAFLKRPFDLERELPIRGMLIKLSAESHILLLVLHHIQTDGGSYRLLVRELSDRYSMKLNRKPAGDAPLTTSALHWGAAERFYLKTPDAQADIVYWKEHLRDAVPGLRWPHMARPAGVENHPSLGVLQQAIPAKFREAIRAYADAGSGALLRLFLSTYAILLHRLTGQEEVLIGLPVHDRRSARDRTLIGFRMKTLPVCLRISGRMSYRDIVRQLNATLRMAYRHSRLPSGALNALIPTGDQRSPGRLFHSLFNQREDMLEDVDFSGLTTDVFPLHVSTPKADLSVILTSRPGVEALMREGIGLHYDRNIFGADDVRMLFDRWMMILRQCLTDPSIHVDETDILLPEENESSRWLMESGVRKEYPRTSLHALVVDMARRHPDRPAVVTPDGELGYGMLDNLSASLAAYLREQGVGRETVVGIRVGRGPEFVIACLAVLRAGGAILTVAPDLPPARVSLMLRDASAPLCLTDEAMSEEMGLGIRVLDLRRCIERSRYCTGADALPDVSGSRLAYIMYTSGSTGRPKGVMVEHRHILNRLLHTRELLGFGPDDRALHRSAISFDVWIPEVFLPLISGGAVVMPAGHTPPGPEEIADLIEQFDITYVHFVPGMLSQFLDLAYRPGVDRILRTIWCGGESLSDETMQRCLKHYRAALYHGYGPTETAVGVAYWKASSSHGHPKPPIGRPFANTILRVVDARGRRVPPGVTGELWIGGAQTGRGYVNDPSLTRDRFVEDPLDPGSGLRFYRSGDLARFLPDGQLLFMGRADEQVKIRGQRVEPEEVSVALRGCPGVREALVMAEPDGSGGLRLRGWVTPDAVGRTDAEILRRHLSEQLPSYMIPWRIEVLSSWPLTAHGKVDRQALLSMTATLRTTGGQGGTPLEGMESNIAGIWCEVLGLSSVGRSDEFFSLGGHSLHALRVTGLVQSRLGIPVKLSDLYAHPRFSDLSAALSARGEGTSVSLVASQGALSEAPMSAGQRRMWLLDGLLAAPSAYHVTRLLRMDGPADLSVTERVLGVLVRRHEILRTVLIERDGELLQHVLPDSGFELPLTSEVMAAEAVPARLQAERMRRFALSETPAWRVLHIHTPTGDLLYFTFHHALTDEWSMRIFFTEYARLQSTGVDERQAGLSVQTHRYTDFGLWQSGWLKGAEAAQRRDYWRRSLADLSEVLRLSPDLPVTDPLPGRQGRCSVTLPASLRDGVLSASQREGVTPFTLLLGTWQVLLYRLTGSEDILIGTPVSERRASCWQGLMGLFLNMVPVRMRVSGGMSFREHVQQLRGLLESVMEYADLPYEDILSLTEPGLVLPVHGLTPTAFVWNERSERPLPFGQEDPDVVFARRDLTCVCASGSDSIEITLVYDQSRFMSTNMDLLLKRYVELTARLTHRLDQRVEESSIMLPGEEEWLRSSVESGGLNPYPAKTLHVLFRETVLRFPEQVAVRSDAESFTYRELDRLSDLFAHRIFEKGIGRDSVVALLMPRSPRMLAWMLAALKSGGAFLLVDPSMPAIRIRSVIQEARASLCVEGHVPTELSTFISCPVLRDDMSDNGNAYTKRSHHDIPDVGDDALAYVMFTSGSSGVPKGAMIEHRQIVNRLMFTKGVFGFDEADRTLQKSPLSFDVCITEWFLPLLSGGTVIVAGEASAVSSLSIAALVSRHRVTYLHFVPSMLRDFLSLSDLSGVNDSLRIIRCGGESLTDDLIRSCSDRLRATLYQSYGPAETAVAVTLWRATNGHEYPKPPIGRPNANTILRVVDARGRRVPPGVTGELWIGGAQTGRGYVNDPSLTRDRFVEDPLDPGSGLRFYRSGDLARFLPDGQLLFMGRADEQVKIRGQRVEPEEVSVALRGCPGVREALVMAEPDGSGGLRLRGWVTPDAVGRTDAEILRRHLSEQLPSYMIPWRIEVLSSWPLTAHGKVDRQALLSMTATLRTTGGQGGTPLEGMESNIAGIWCEVLGLSSVGRSDEFFSLGGHSLHALRVTGLVQSRLGIPVKLSDLYAHPRFSDLSAALSARGEGTSVSLVASQGALSEAPMSAGQRRMWLLDGLLAAPSAYHVTRLLRMDGPADLSVTERVLGVLVRRHEILRTVLIERDGELLQHVLPDSGFELPLTSEVMAAEAVPARLQAERMRRFALSETPAWRVLHIHTPTGDLLYFTFHHALTDEWSMRIFFTEYARLQSTGVDERQAGLSVQTHRYTDFGLWQSGWLKGAEAAQRRDYWRRSLADLSEVLRLSPDLPVTDPLPGRQGRCSVTLPASLRDGVLSASQREGVTPFTLLLGTWQVLLYRLTGSEDILIGTPVSERRASCWQGLMGLFLNMVPVRMRVSGGMSFREHVQQLRGLLESVMEHADLPFAEIAALASGLDAGPFHSILQFSFIIREREDEPTPALLSFSADKPHSTHAADDVVFLADISGSEWVMGIKYDRDRFSGERMDIFLQTYQWLLEQMIIEDGRPIQELSLVKESERKRLLELGLGQRRALPRDPFIHRLFERQAERRPEAVAVDHLGSRISYATLNTNASRWATHLIGSYDLVPGEVVALILPQGIPHVTLVLAVMKAGAAVVPIDPELPDVRIRHMLNDCGARIVVTDGRGLVHLSARHQRVDPAEEPIDEAFRHPDVALDPGAPAYGMYTSGTTGMPKGIFNTHLGFCNMIASNAHAMGIVETDRIAQLSTPSFDVSLFEIFLALHNGATVVIPGRLELSVLPSFIVEKRVSVAMLTPMVVSTLDTGTLSHLRVLMTGGEEARPADVMRVCEHISYFNIYGPTEVSVWSTLQPVSTHEDPSRMVPIGRPMDNYFVCILDAGMHMLPAGITGELYIGGIGLGLGYHDRPDLTSERFVSSPFRPGDRLYRTGDLAWWNACGELMYAGRKDGQVKVMGFRVELREVERELERLVHIRQAAVIPVKRPGGEQLLAGFVVGEGSAIPGDAEIREALARRLPRYMLPDRIHQLPEIPLNHNGKVDRRRLEQLDAEISERISVSASQDGSGLPSTSTEQGLAEIWSSLLGRGAIPAAASFFSLGGNSLQLIRLMVMIRDRWGLRLDVTRIYTHITLRSMAGFIDETLGSAPSGEPCGIRPVEVWGNGHGYPVFVMVGGAGSVEEYTKYHRIGEQLGEGYRLMILPDPDTASGGFPTRDLSTLADAYARYIRSDLPGGPVILLGDCIGGIDAYATACALQRLGVDDVAVVMLDTTAPGYLSRMSAAVSVRRELEAMPARA